MKTLIGCVTAAILFVVQIANATTITRDELHPFHDPDLVRYVAAIGSIPAVIIANPFGAGQDQALLTTLPMPAYLPPTTLLPTTARDRNDGHLALIFEPVTASNGHAACATPNRQTTATNAGPKAGIANILRLQIAFCYDREVVSEAFMEMRQPKALGDRDFSIAMAQLLSVLLPSQNTRSAKCQGSMMANG